MSRLIWICTIYKNIYIGLQGWKDLQLLLWEKKKNKKKKKQKKKKNKKNKTKTLFQIANILFCICLTLSDVG